MFLGIYNRRGAGACQSQHASLLNEFALDGQRDLSIITEGNLLLASVNGAVLHRPGELLLAGSGDAYDNDPTRRSAPLTEQVADLYAKDGDRFTPPANGNFSFALYDAPSDTLHLGNDAFGFHPLFVLQNEDYCFFSNEIEPLARCFEDGPELDKNAVAQLFVFWTTLGNRTLLKGVQNMEPGSVMTFRGDRFSERKYDALAIPVDHAKDYDEHVKTVAEAFEAGVRHRANQHDNPGSCLTAGADTRLILSCLTAEQRERMHFVTHFGIEGGDEWDRDVVVSKMIADIAGLKHTATLIPDARKPFSASVFREYRERTGTPGELHGINGGEFLGGACVDVALFPVDQVGREAVDRRLGEVFEPAFLEGLTEHPFDTLQHEYDRLAAGNKEELFWIKIFGRAFFTHLYAGSGGLRTSRWMVPWTFGTKVATPFMDANVLRALLAVPFEDTTGYGLYNSVYKNHYPEFTSLPTNSNLTVRSDAALAVQLEGKEPKKDVLGDAHIGRQESFREISSRGALWRRGIYNRSYVEARVRGELADSGKPSLMSRLKAGYTGGLIFKLRGALPIHGTVMNWKAKREAAQNAKLDFSLNGPLIDFEYWCDYMGIDGEPAHSSGDHSAAGSGSEKHMAVDGKSAARSSAKAIEPTRPHTTTPGMQ